MDTFDSAQTSQSRSRPIILYTITTSSGVHRHTTSAMDVVFGDQTFTALTIAHDDEQISDDASGDELVIHLPISHPLIQRYASTGIPEQTVQVLVQELQSATATAALSWSGPAQSVSIDGQLASIRIPTSTNDALRIQLPVIAAQRTCNHVLFDHGCAPNPGGPDPGDGTNPIGGGPDPNAFTLSATLDDVSADGLTLTFRFLGGLGSGEFDFGILTGTIFDSNFVGEDQTRSIISQTGLVVTIGVPFVATRDQLLATVWSIRSGCDHTMATCIAKFNNRVNFGGHPTLLSSVNLWAPNGLGIVSQV